MNLKHYIKGEYILMMVIIAAIVGGILVIYVSTIPTCGEIAAEKCMEYCIKVGCFCNR